MLKTPMRLYAGLVKRYENLTANYNETWSKVRLETRYYIVLRSGYILSDTKNLYNNKKLKKTRPGVLVMPDPFG